MQRKTPGCSCWGPNGRQATHPHSGLHRDARLADELRGRQGAGGGGSGQENGMQAWSEGETRQRAAGQGTRRAALGTQQRCRTTRPRPTCRYSGHTRSCCVTGRLVSARSNRRRVRVTNFWVSMNSRYLLGWVGGWRSGGDAGRDGPAGVWEGGRVHPKSPAGALLRDRSGAEGAAPPSSAHHPCPCPPPCPPPSPGATPT